MAVTETAERVYHCMELGREFHVEGLTLVTMTCKNDLSPNAFDPEQGILSRLVSCITITVSVSLSRRVKFSGGGVQMEKF